MKIIKGKLHPYFETGTEGTIWSLYEDGKQGYDGLNCLEKGDKLTIYNADGSREIIKNLVIQPNFETGKLKKNQQPQALGLWIHWTQDKWHQDAWAILFLSELPAILERE